MRSTEPLDIVQLDFPPLFATVIHPQIEIKTSEARAMLPTHVPLKEAVRNWSNLGSFVAALAKRDYGLMSRSMEDTIVEPVRKKLIPKFDEVKARALALGAVGAGISGSGPSMFALCETRDVAANILRDVSELYLHGGLDFNFHISEIVNSGAVINS